MLFSCILLNIYEQPIYILWIYQINKGFQWHLLISSKPEIYTMIIYQLTHTEPRFDPV